MDQPQTREPCLAGHVHTIQNDHARWQPSTTNAMTGRWSAARFTQLNTTWHCYQDMTKPPTWSDPGRGFFAFKALTKSNSILRSILTKMKNHRSLEHQWFFVVRSMGLEAIAWSQHIVNDALFAGLFSVFCFLVTIIFGRSYILNFHPQPLCHRQIDDLCSLLEIAADLLSVHSESIHRF